MRRFDGGWFDYIRLIIVGFSPNKMSPTCHNVPVFSLLSPAIFHFSRQGRSPYFGIVLTLNARLPDWRQAFQTLKCSSASGGRPFYASDATPHATDDLLNVKMVFRIRRTTILSFRCHSACHGRPSEASDATPRVTDDLPKLQMPLLVARMTIFRGKCHLLESARPSAKPEYAQRTPVSALSLLPSAFRLLLRHLDLDMQVAQLARLDAGGGIGHQVRALGRLGEGDDVADAGRAAQNGDQSGRSPGRCRRAAGRRNGRPPACSRTAP